jgi:PEP-CTERM motif-containing protein
MKKLLFAAALCVLAAPAYAQSCTTDSSGNTFCDPADLHVTSPTATGSDPVLLNDNTTFTIKDVSNGATIDQPLTIYFAVVTGQAKPIVTDWSFDGGPTTPFVGSLSNEGTWTPTASGTSKNLYSFVGCGGCDGSINKSNVDAIETTLGLGPAPTFNVFNLVLPVGFSGNTDFVTVDGTFSLGTIIAPLAEDIVGRKTTFYDTSWTNAGVVNDAVPEPSTWAMMLIGFAGLGFAGYRKAHSARTALSAA